jgi:DMSO/TMAO reductase YedYZ heme-binding membrane subunit
VSPQAWWFVARATGIVAYCLLGITVIVGLAISARVVGRRPPPDWVLDWHRFLGAASVVFSVGHIVAIWADDYIDFGIAELLVPFVSQWRPIAVGIGVTAWWAVVVVEVTSLLRRRLPVRWWRRCHHLSVPAFAAVTAHFLMAGEDGDEPIVIAMVGAMCGVVAVLLVLWLVPVVTTVSSARPERASR